MSRAKKADETKFNISLTQFNWWINMRHRLRNRMFMQPDVDEKPGVAQPDVPMWSLTLQMQQMQQKPQKPQTATDAADATIATDATWRKISRLQGIKKDPVGNNTAQGLTRAHGLFYKVKPKSAKTEKKEKNRQLRHFNKNNLVGSKNRRIFAAWFRNEV